MSSVRERRLRSDYERLGDLISAHKRNLTIECARGNAGSAQCPERSSQRLISSAQTSKPDHRVAVPRSLSARSGPAKAEAPGHPAEQSAMAHAERGRIGRAKNSPATDLRKAD